MWGGEIQEPEPRIRLGGIRQSDLSQQVFDWGGQIPGIFLSLLSMKLALLVLHLCTSVRWIAKPF